MFRWISKKIHKYILHYRFFLVFAETDQLFLYFDRLWILTPVKLCVLEYFLTILALF